MKGQKMTIALSRTIWLGLSLIVFASCSTRVGQNIVKYSKSYQVEEKFLQAEVLSSSEDLYGAYGLFYVDKNHLLIRFIQDDFFGIWNVNESRIERKFIRKGRGPGEFLSVSTPHPRLGNNEEILLDILSNSSIITVDYSSVLNGNADYIVSMINRDRCASGGRLYSSYLMGENILSQVKGDQDICSFKLLRIEDGEIIKTYPVALLFEEDAINMDFSFDDLLKPDRSKLALLMYEFNRIIVFDVGGGNHICIETNREDGAVYDYGTCSDQYIYAFYGLKNGRKEIHVFDWEGNFLRVLDTSCDLMDIAVNEDDTYLYALTYDNKMLAFALE